MRVLRYVNIVISLLSALNLASQNSWTQKANFGGGQRYGAIAFSIGSKGYLGTGTGGGSIGFQKDLWEYDPLVDTWTKMANLPDSIRLGAVGFSIGNKGYIATGYGTKLLDDLWEFDPVLNTWTKKASMPIARFDAGVFVIGSKAYIVAGQGNAGHLKDVWEWNSITNIWTQKGDFGGGYRFEPTGFTIGSFGYLGLGNSAGSSHNDFWEYNSITDVWTQKAIFGGNPREEAVGFTIDSLGYILTGSTVGGSSLIYYQDFWKFNPVANKWTQLPNFSGAPRGEARGFSIGKKGYIGTGLPLCTDFWEWAPTNTGGTNDFISTIEVKIYPNPSSSSITIQSSTDLGSITIFNSLGEIVLQTKSKNIQEQLDISKFSSGFYYLQVQGSYIKLVKE